MKRYRDWKLTAKVLVPVGCALLLVAILGTVLIYRQQMRQVHVQAAKMAHALALQIAEDRSYYTTNVVAKLKEQYQDEQRSSHGAPPGGITGRAARAAR